MSTATVRGCEHEEITLTCAQGTIDVIEASYGRTHDDSVCEHEATSDQSCHAQESTSIVKGSCQGQMSCTIEASNGVFGDPCGGTFKYLTVNYQCMPEHVFDVQINTNGLSFNQIPMVEGVQCWHDRADYQYLQVPSELMPGTLFQGNHKAIPVGTEISFTNTDSRDVTLHLFFEHTNGRHGGWDENLVGRGWAHDGAGPHWVDVVGGNGDNPMASGRCASFSHTSA